MFLEARIFPLSNVGDIGDVGEDDDTTCFCWPKLFSFIMFGMLGIFGISLVFGCQNFFSPSSVLTCQVGMSLQGKYNCFDRANTTNFTAQI